MTAPPPNDWNDCPPGEIAGLVNSLKQQRRRETLQQAAGVTTVIVLLAFVASSLLPGFFRGQTPVQAIACQKVLQLAPQYVAQQLGGDVTAQIDQHLKDCKRCRDHIHADYPKFPLPAGAATNCITLTGPMAVANFWRLTGMWVPRYQSER
jgi:hypothetical protein